LPAWAVRRAHLILAEYAHHHAHCDVLVAGGGPAGLAAALAASAAGARVIIADEGSEFGGNLLSERADHRCEPALNWVKHTLAALRALPGQCRAQPQHSVRLFRTITRSHFPNVPRSLRPTHLPNGLWKVRAAQVVLATGALGAPARVSRQDAPA